MKCKHKIYLIGFFIPLYSLSVNLFVQWSWYKLLPFYLIFLITFSRKKYFTRGRNTTVFFLLLYILAITVYNYVNNLGLGHFESAIFSGQNAVRAYGHMIIQMIFMVVTISQIFYFKGLIYDEKDVSRLINGYIDGNILSVVIGFMQYLLFNLDSLPEYFINKQYYDYSANLFRINGLGGEPRHFAAFALIAFFILLAVDLTGNSINIKRRTAKKVVLLLGIFFSYATSAWIGSGLGLIFVAVVSRNIKQLTVILLFILIAIILPIASKTVFEVVDARLLSRIDTIEKLMSFAPKDSLALYLLKSDWLLALFGVGAGGMHYHIIDGAFLASVPESITKAGIVQAFYYENQGATSFTASSFILNFTVEYGLIGLFLMMLFIIQIIRSVDDKYRKFIIILSLTVLFSNTVSSMFTYVYISCLGIVNGYSANKYIARIHSDGFNSKMLPRIKWTRQ